MKKIIIAFVLIFSIVLCLSSCDEPAQTDNEAEMNNLNAMAAIDYSVYSIEINVKSTFGNEVTEKYSVIDVNDSKTVRYHIERLNSFAVNGDTVTVPDEYKTVSSGTLEASESNNAKYALPTFNFSSETISVNTIYDEDGIRVLEGSIISPVGFIGSDINGTNIQVSVQFTEKYLEKIVITYENGDSFTTITYVIE